MRVLNKIKMHEIARTQEGIIILCPTQSSFIGILLLSLKARGNNWRFFVLKKSKIHDSIPNCGFWAKMQSDPSEHTHECLRSWRDLYQNIIMTLARAPKAREKLEVSQVSCIESLKNCKNTLPNWVVCVIYPKRTNPTHSQRVTFGALPRWN